MCIAFCHFFGSLNLVIFIFGLKHIGTGYIVNATPPTVLAVSFLNFAGCFCQGLKMCMTFGCNPQINFCHFSQFKLSRFWLNFYQII